MEVADHTVRLWDVKNGRMLRALGSHQATVTSIALDSASRILVSGSDDSEVILWDFLTLLGDQAATARLLPTREGHRGPILSVAIDPADRILASGSADKTIKLWEADTGRLTADAGRA